MTATGRAKARTTMVDIASVCGVSVATVSLALRGSPLVNEQTRERVERASERLGYVRNRSAANLRRRVSTSVALVINDLANPFFAEFAAGVDEALAAAGYITLLGGTGESPDRQDVVIRSLMEHSPAALILSPAEGSFGSNLHSLLGYLLPTLVSNREVAGGDWDFLVCDNRYGAHLATRHLLALGHERIAFVGGHRSSSSCRERHRGYMDALVSSCILPHDAWVMECAPVRDEAAALGRQLPGLLPDVTAAVCYNDIVALGLMQGLAASGVQAGRDFAVTGFDDIDEAALFSPPLTTVSAGPGALGRRAAELILEQIEGGHHREGERKIVAPVELVVRSSSCPPLHGASTSTDGARDTGKDMKAP